MWLLRFTIITLINWELTLASSNLVNTHHLVVYICVLNELIKAHICPNLANRNILTVRTKITFWIIVNRIRQGAELSQEIKMYDY